MDPEWKRWTRILVWEQLETPCILRIAVENIAGEDMDALSKML